MMRASSSASLKFSNDSRVVPAQLERYNPAWNLLRVDAEMRLRKRNNDNYSRADDCSRGTGGESDRARARARDTSNCRFTRLHEDRWIGTSGNARRNFTTGNGRKHRSSARTTRTAESWIRAVIANEKETERDGFCWQLLIARIRIACAFSRSARGGTRIETANRSMARALSSFGNAKSRKLICKPFPADGTNTQEISYLGPEKPETPSSENIFFQIIRIARLFGAVVVCDGFANVNSTSCAITWLSEGSS